MGMTSIFSLRKPRDWDQRQHRSNWPIDPCDASRVLDVATWEFVDKHAKRERFWLQGLKSKLHQRALCLRVSSYSELPIRRAVRGVRRQSSVLHAASQTVHQAACRDGMLRGSSSNERARNPLRYSSEGGYLCPTGLRQLGQLGVMLAAYGNLPRPETWLPYVFASPEEAAEAGICELSSVSWYGKR
jgi:hypothetical protein